LDFPSLSFGFPSGCFAFPSVGLENATSAIVAAFGEAPDDRPRFLSAGKTACLTASLTAIAVCAWLGWSTTSTPPGPLTQRGGLALGIDIIR
jgi:hypothetical protein